MHRFVQSAARSARTLSQYHAQVSTRLIHTSTPRQSIASTVRGAVGQAFTQSEEKTDQDVYDTQMKYFLDESRAIDANTYVDLLRDWKKAVGIGGVKEHLPWVQNNPALGEFKIRESILLALTPSEREDVSTVSVSALKRISREVN